MTGELTSEKLYLACMINGIEGMIIYDLPSQSIDYSATIDSSAQYMEKVYQIPFHTSELFFITRGFGAFSDVRFC
jgi:hypothetical protein